MFGDLKNFKDVAHLISMKEAVIMLNGCFEYIDDTLALYPSLEKIKTISSKILIAGGINNEGDHFLEDMTNLALNLVEYFEEPKDFEVENETIQVKLDMGFGIAYGPIVAGIVGKKKFVYEIYGDVVNTSSRMCSLAKGNDIVVTEKCYELCQDKYECICLGEKYVKGKGEIPVYNIRKMKIQEASTSKKHYDSNEFLSTVAKSVHSKSSSTEPDILESMIGSIGDVDSNNKKKLGSSMHLSNSLLTRQEIVKSIHSLYASFNKSNTGINQCGNEDSRSDFNTASIPDLAKKDFQAKKIDPSRNRRQSIVPQTIIDIANKKRSKLAQSDIVSSEDSLQTNSTGSRSILGSKNRLLDKLYRSMSLDRISNESNNSKENLNSQKPLMRTTVSASSKEVGKSAYNAFKSAAQQDKTEISDKTKKPKTGENAEENKEFLIDVIMRMIKKIGSKGKKSSKKFFKEIYKEVDDFSLKFKHKSLEEQFKLDFTLATTWPFLRCSLQVLFIEAAMVALAIISAKAQDVDFERNEQSFKQLLACTVIGVGLQLLMCGITVFTAGDDEPSPSVAFRMFQYCISTLTLAVTSVMITLEWSDLYRYHFLAEGTIPFLVSFFLIRMDGIIFINKLATSIMFGVGFIIYQHTYQAVYLQASDSISWQGSLSVVLLFSVWCVAFHRFEKSTRFEYLIDAIMETQADLVSEEILKSATVLNSILPQLVIEKLLLDPNSIVYEEFTIISVLQLDIAGYVTF